MNRIILYISSFFNKNINKSTSIPLGRWNIDKCINKINIKIDMSNNDHCGTCHNYLTNKIISN